MANGKLAVGRRTPKSILAVTSQGKTTSAVTLSVDRICRAVSTSMSVACLALVQRAQMSATIWLDTTSQRPSDASTKARVFDGNLKLLISGSAETTGFARMSPMDRDTARYPGTTRETSPNRCWTWPPRE